MKSDLLLRLQSYSALSISFIAASEFADGQIIHSDIQPEITLNRSGAAFYIDLNNDRINDFEVRVNTFYQYKSKINGGIFATALEKNSIAGTGSGSTFFALALNSGERIGKNLQWNRGENQ